MNEYEAVNQVVAELDAIGYFDEGTGLAAAWNTAVEFAAEQVAEGETDERYVVAAQAGLQ